MPDIELPTPDHDLDVDHLEDDEDEESYYIGESRIFAFGEHEITGLVEETFTELGHPTYRIRDQRSGKLYDIKAVDILWSSPVEEKD